MKNTFEKRTAHWAAKKERKTGNGLPARPEVIRASRWQDTKEKNPFEQTYGRSVWL